MGCGPAAAGKRWPQREGEGCEVRVARPVGAGLLLLGVMGLAGGSRNRNQLGEKAEKMPPQLPHLHT